MSAHTDILFDFNHMMSEAIEASGLHRDEIDRLAGQAGEVHQALVDLRRLGQLPFRDLPYHDDIAEAVALKGRRVREKFETVLLLGVGGSALGAELLCSSLGDGKGTQVIVCDGVDAGVWRRLGSNLNWEKTLLLIVSKSGNTIETWASFSFFEKLLKDRLGSPYRQNVFIVSDPKAGPFRDLAEEEGIETFSIPPGVGGRYSVLTPAGLLPAACAGVDIAELLAGARRMDERCKSGDPWFNPALMSAVLHHLFANQRGRNVRVTLTYGERLASYAPWFAQLWAESLGKSYRTDGERKRTGTTPICASGPQDQHSQLQLYLDGPEDKTVTFLAEEEVGDVEIPVHGRGWKGMSIPKTVHELQTLERTATEEALREAGRPNATILLKRLDPYAVGQLIYLAELETVYAGHLQGVNPFDQPAVEMIKKNIKGFLSGRIPHARNRTYQI